MDTKRLDLLEMILNQVNDWLRFAEAKNGALVAVGCAIVFGVLRIYSSVSIESNLVSLYILFATGFVVAAIVISLVSFVPRLTPPFWIKMPGIQNSDNPLFFAHACKYSKGKYLELFEDHVGATVDSTNKLELALCDQIVTNSRISFIKYRMFGSAVFLLLAGVLTPLGALILYWVRE